MQNSCKKWLKAAAFMALLGFAPEMFAQAVIFPQEEQAGAASVTSDGGKFTISNNLLSVSFTKTSENKLVFDGWPALSIKPSTEIFKIQVDDGTVITSSQMQLDKVEEVTLMGKSEKARASLRLPGKAIEAHYTFKDKANHDLSIVWRAVLRDGSHYLRTEMDITANTTTDMYSVIPMEFEVSNRVDGKIVQGPSVVGNTRGAVIMNDKFFAGLETPTAYNYINAGNVDDIKSFNPNGWNINSFKWNPAKETPQEILDHGTEGNATPLTSDYVFAARGGVIFQEEGPLTVTFNHADGAKALHIVGVDVINKNGHIVSADYHVGKAGNPAKLNEYHLNIPEKECYLVRYFVENRTENYQTDNKNGSGTISLSLKTREKAPTLKVLFDGPIGAAPERMLFANFGNSARAVVKAATSIGTDKIAGQWVQSDWKQMKDIPEFLWKNGFPANKVKSIEKPVQITQSGKLVVDFQYQGGSHGINIVGVDLVDAEGNVVASDYHKDFTGGNKNVIAYTLTAFKGDYTLRYIAEDKTESIDNNGKINIQLTPATTISVGETGTDAWKTADWSDMGSVPQGVLDLGFSADQVKSYEKFMDFTAEASDVAVNFTYASGDHRLNLAGVDLIDAQGNVVSSDYHKGFTGSAHGDNTYHVSVPAAGSYKLRYIGHTVGDRGQHETISSTGNIAFTSTALDKLIGTTDNWVTSSWTKMQKVPQGVRDLGLADGDVKSYEKKVSVSADASDYTFTFQYVAGGGGNKLKLAGVDLVDGAGNVVASDYHKGVTGGSSTGNTYHFLVPKKGVYKLRYIAHTKEDNGKFEDIASKGNITIAYAAVTLVNEKKSASDSWKQADWQLMSQVPDAVLKMQGVQAANVHFKTKQLYVDGNGNVSVGFKYAGGNNRLNMVGVDLLDADNKVVASDYHAGFTGNDHSNNGYTLEGVKPGLYTVRYIVNKSEPLTSNGNITIGFSVKDSYQIGADQVDYRKWTATSWTTLTDVPLRVREVVGSEARVKCMTATVDLNEFKQRFELEDVLEVVFQSVSTPKLKIAGVELLNSNGQVVKSDYHKGSTGIGKDETSANVYRLNEPNTGVYTLRYIAYEEGNETINSTGYITATYNTVHTFHLPSPEISPVIGKWSRNVDLEAGKTWNVSSVVGLVAKNQPRRSVLSYVERERAVPWRPYPIYNSWYELNINRNNDEHYTTNMNEGQCLDILTQWKEKFFDVYNTGIKAFVWDDGWDVYGRWSFNTNFQPYGFSRMDTKAREMNAGTGCWLGPVGGYGTSGNYRRNYWSDKGGMQLSNPLYYEVFYNACDSLLTKRGYDFRYFKFDGISGQFSAVGPDGGDTGNENAEGIINAELTMRKIKDDIFFNTSVGTWASPFWFQITDAVWRQENDYGEAGNHGNSRERWITYRDRLVYQNFVQNSPMCPINNLMTHGFILTSHGGSGDRDYNAIVREMRCAFACGSAMVELYNDYELMNNINGGKLWGELAKCIKWQEANADALPDAHWVGGNPWDGSKHEIYGWAGWNGKNAVFTLRNGDEKPQKIKFTLRDALEIPKFVSGTITFNKGFDDQAELDGFVAGQPIDIDTPFELTLPGSSVYIFDNTQEAAAIDAAKDKLAAAIKKAEPVVALLGEGTGKYTCAGLAEKKVEAQGVWDNLYATQAQVDNATKSLNDVLATAQLNAPETGKFYRIKAFENHTEANKTQVYLSSALEAGNHMKMVADANDVSTLFYLSADGHLTACGAMRNVSSYGLADNMGDTHEFLKHNNQLGHYTIKSSSQNSPLVAWNGTADRTSTAASDNAGAWELIEVPVEKAYQHAVTITAAGYSTIFAPVALSVPTAVKAFTGTVDESKEIMKLVPVEGVIPAGTAVVLKGVPENYLFDFVPSSSFVPADNHLSGSFVNITKPTATKIYTLQQLNGRMGFFLYGGETLSAGKAYLELPLSQRVKGFIFDEGDATGIEDIELTEETVVYDLAGRRILTPTSGLYIVNGKKVYIK